MRLTGSNSSDINRLFFLIFVRPRSEIIIIIGRGMPKASYYSYFHDTATFEIAFNIRSAE